MTFGDTSGIPFQSEKVVIRIGVIFHMPWTPGEGWHVPVLQRTRNLGLNFWGCGAISFGALVLCESRPKADGSSPANSFFSEATTDPMGHPAGRSELFDISRYMYVRNIECMNQLYIYICAYVVYVVYYSCVCMCTTHHDKGLSPSI